MNTTPLTFLLLLAIVSAGCKPQADKTDDQTSSPWQAEMQVTLAGFQVPECALPDPDTGRTYVSNIESEPDAYWADDQQGHLSLISAELQVVEARWVDSNPDQILHSPKGMCLLDGKLYFTDNDRLMRCNASGGSVELVVDGFEQANDLATDGTHIWLSDTAAGKIFCITPEGGQREIKSPKGINGITFSGEQMFGVSWDLHEIYELDPAGEKEPLAFGIADHFVNLDGIEVLEDGCFLVSDFMGNAVFLIESDRSTVHKLIDIPTPADIGIHRKKGLLYVPQFMEDKLSIFRLTR